MITKIPDKLAFKKREVVNITRLDGKVLDYWEKEFEMLNPVINKNGEKFFSRNDIEVIIRIKELLIGEKRDKDEAKNILLSEFGMLNSPDIKEKISDSPSKKRLTEVKEGLLDILTLLDKDDK